MLRSTTSVNGTVVFDIRFSSFATAVAAQEAVQRGEIPGAQLLSAPLTLPPSSPTPAPAGPPTVSQFPSWFPDWVSVPVLVAILAGIGVFFLVVVVLIVRCCRKAGPSGAAGLAGSAASRLRGSSVAKRGAVKRTAGSSLGPGGSGALGVMSDEQVQLLALNELEAEWTPPPLRRPARPPARPMMANEIDLDLI